MKNLNWLDGMMMWFVVDEFSDRLINKIKNPSQNNPIEKNVFEVKKPKMKEEDSEAIIFILAICIIAPILLIAYF